MFAGVLFDFDGTLVDTSELVIKSFQHTLAPYLGRMVAPEEIYPYFGIPLRDGLSAFVPGKPELVEEMLPVYRRFSEEHFDNLVQPCPGVREGLEQLLAAGIKLGIVTSRVRDTTLYGLRLFNLEDFFPVVVTMEDVRSHKPGPEPVQRGVELLQLAPADVAMIGDSPHDILAARAAGVTSVAATWSKIPRERLLAARPDAVVNTMTEFVDFCLDGNLAAVNICGPVSHGG
ncbi:HAD hydrolase, subfamily IA [Moorella glycerini]|uniref:Pyrophosphatase PpaX n=1 Tax=Neomoorella stamsii TaxID=1266720 RepID=A0A9X7P4T1_9FIRM|nr:MULTISPECIES: HAD family hydrolase [Moorella]PRR68904.1 Pyrophosphatase PpaX [Moorella stamsii]CEP67525.1 HAD hydrolase, subfamily IA [Moorella glycerini]